MSRTKQECFYNIVFWPINFSLYLFQIFLKDCIIYKKKTVLFLKWKDKKIFLQKGTLSNIVILPP